MTPSHERRYDLDWLRVLGVLLLVPFHVALIFVLDLNYSMYVKAEVDSRLLREAAGFVYLWYMPMLFAISGAVTYLALGFRSAGLPLFLALRTEKGQGTGHRVDPGCLRAVPIAAGVKLDGQPS